VDVEFLRQAMTVVSFLAFVGIVAYAVHPRNRSRFEEAARIPFEEREGGEGR